MPNYETPEENAWGEESVDVDAWEAFWKPRVLTYPEYVARFKAVVEQIRAGSPALPPNPQEETTD